MLPRFATALLLALVLVCAPVLAPVLAAPAGGPLTLAAAVQILQTHKLIDPKPLAELRLADPVTRAEAAKILGAALKGQEEAKARQETAAFPDTGGHWANGWIQVARDRGLFQGRPDGGFHPDAPVTYAETITALLRLIGWHREAGIDWPWGAITKALDLELLPPDLNLSGRLMAPAPRGDLFRLAAMAIGRVPIAGTELSLLQSLHDQRPPDLALTGFPSAAVAESLAVTGLAVDAVTVLIDGQPAEVAADGSFAGRVILSPGENRISVVAFDGAGNRTESVAQIHYQPLIGLELEPAAIHVTVDQPFSVAVSQQDASGAHAPARNVTWEYDPALLRRDEQTGQFRALQPGEFTLRAALGGVEGRAEVIAAGTAARVELQADRVTLTAGGPPTAVRVRILDEYGRLHPKSQQVQLAVVPQGTGALDSSALTVTGGEAVAYLAPGDRPGGLGVQARVPALRELQAPLLPIRIEPRRLAAIQLQATPAHVVPVAGRSISVIATAVDQSGTPFAVPADVVVTLHTTAADVVGISHPFALIRAGSASSTAGGQNGLAAVAGAAGEAVISGAAGTVPVEAATVQAVRAGELTRLEAQPLQGGALADGLSAAVVAVARVDSAGVIVSDSNLPVVLVSPSTTATVAPLTDVGGVATFAVRSSTRGRVKLIAGVVGRPELNSLPVEVAFLPATGGGRPVIRTAASEARAGESLPVHVALQTSTGRPVANPGPPLAIRLEVSGAASLQQGEVTILPGATDSELVLVHLPVTAGAVTLSGAMAGGQVLSPATVKVLAAPPPVPGPTVAGRHLAAFAATGGRQPLAGEETRFLIQARDGQQVRAGAYAFAIRVRLNGVEVDDFPANLQVTLGNRPANLLTGRTTQGEAEVWVRYTGTGTVSVEPVPVSASGAAYDQWGVPGYAQGTVGEGAAAAAVTYVAGPLSHVQASVSPHLGHALYGVIKAARGRSASIRVRPVDDYGNPAGNGCVATLSRVGGVPEDSMAIRSGSADLPEHTRTVDGTGAAEFTVVVLNGVEGWSEWLPSVSCSTAAVATTERIRIETTAAGAITPVIEFAGGDFSGAGEVGAADAELLIRVGERSGTPAGAELLVYDDDQLIGRFGPVYPGQPAPAQRTVAVPKALLGSYSHTVLLRVRVNVGHEVGADAESRTIRYRIEP